MPFSSQFYSTAFESYGSHNLRVFAWRCYNYNIIILIFIILPLVKQTCDFLTFVFRPLPICPEGLSLADIIKMQKGRSKLQT